jgi:hypothetical protein
MKTIGCTLSGLWCGLEPSMSRILPPGIAAMLVVMLALARSTSLRGLMLYLSRPFLRASAAQSKVRQDTPFAATGFGSGLREEGSHPYLMRVLSATIHGVLRVPSRARCAERAKEHALPIFARLDILLVDVQERADGLGDAEAKNEASPLKPTKPTKVGARTAAGSTRAAEPDGSRRPGSSLPRSAPLVSALEQPHTTAFNSV